MIRDLTHAEKSSLYAEGRCPFCSSSLFFEGPQNHDRVCINWTCAAPNCEAGFNLAPAAMWFGHLIRPPKNMLARSLPVQYRCAPNTLVPPRKSYLPWKNDGTRG